MSHFRKANLPAVTSGTIQNTQEAVRFLEAVKQNLDIITGRSRAVQEIAPLPANATLSQVIATINQIASHLNSSGAGEGD